MLRINKKGGDCLAIFASMPEHLKANLLDLLCLLFPNTIKDVDTALEGMDYEYESIHWDWYNQYST